MGAGEKHLTADGGTDSEEPFFDEEAEEEARPVVPLGVIGDARPSTGRRRGGLPQSLVLTLAVIGAGTAGAAVGYLTFRERAPRPAAEAHAIATPEPVTTLTPASDSAACRTTRPFRTNCCAFFSSRMAVSQAVSATGR